MRRSMNIRGFVLILAVLAVIFLVLHLVLRGNLDSRTEKEKALRMSLTRLEDENRELNVEMNRVDTKDYIVSSAMENYSYVNRDDIRFSFSNPEALYAYSEEEMQILLDEMAE